MAPEVYEDERMTPLVGSGIGHAYFGKNIPIVRDIYISTCTLTIRSASGAGIWNLGASTPTSLASANCTIRDIAGVLSPMIGSSCPSNRIGSLALSLSLSGIISADCKSIAVSSIVISPGSYLFIFADDPAVFGIEPSSSGLFDVVILSQTAAISRCELLRAVSGVFMHIGNLSIPAKDSWNLCISAIFSNGSQCLDIVTSQAQSLIVSVPDLQNYSIHASSLDSERFGLLETCEGSLLLEVESNYSSISGHDCLVRRLVRFQKRVQTVQFRGLLWHAPMQINRAG
jgi:hypothetical protein